MKQCETKKLLSLSMSSKPYRTTPNVLNCHFFEETKSDHSVKVGTHPPHFFMSYHPVLFSVTYHYLKLTQ